MPNTLLTLFNAEGSRQHYAGGFWRDQTIYSLVRDHARRNPDKVAVRSRLSTLTYQQLLTASDSLAADFAERGIVAGQRIAVWLPSRPETIVTLVACSRNGYICCPSLHRDHTVGEVVDLLRRVRAAAVIAQPGYGADADKHDLFAQSASVEGLRHVYRVEKVTSDECGSAVVATKTVGDIVRCPPAPQNPDRVLYLPFTSGTTGAPKGVMHSDNTVLANARALSADWHLDETAVIYTLSPLSHNLGFGAMVMALLIGGEIVVNDLPRGDSLVDRLIRTGSTFLVGVPTHAIDLLTELRARNLSGIGRLKGFRISGAAAPREVVTDLMKHGIAPQSGYGMTETCSHQYTMPGDDERLITESSGRSCSGYEVKIFDIESRDRALPAGKVGQIGGRGASLMLGYFDDQAATEDSFNKDGWFMTGDLGWLDEQGYLRITGRKKDVIIRGGHNIYPARIETLASSYHAIQRAVAVPVADPRLGEKVCLAVAFHPGMHATPDDILSHLHECGLSKYDMPEYFVELDDIPLTASGKIRKRDIVDWIVVGRVTPLPIRWQAR